MKRNKIFISFSTAFAIVCISCACLAYPYTMPNPGDYTDTSGKVEVPCEEAMQGNTMVALVLGQSNSANHGETRHTSGDHVYHFYDNKCYRAADPLPGTTGDRGSVWTRLGDLLVERGDYDNVIFITIGVGGTQVQRWAPGGDLNRRIPDIIRQLKKAGLKPTHVFWHQGETDRMLGTSKDDYKRMFLAMLGDIRRYGVSAPIYVAVATRCGAGGEGYEIQMAQRELVDLDNRIYPGPYSDEITSVDDKFDACHFSGSGLMKHAELWYQSIKYAGD